MIFELLQGGLTKIDFFMILFTFPVVLLSLTVHEYCHGLMAKKLGDPTAKLMGRLSLNPISHLDPFGTAAMLLFGYGWAKAVPVDPRFFRNPKKGMAIVGLAGPVSNFVLAFVSMFFWKILNALTRLHFWIEDGTFWYVQNVDLEFVDYLSMFLLVSVTMNIGLAIFNLIPIPPLDGSRIFYAFLPNKYYFGVMRYERYVMMIMIALLASGLVTLPLGHLSKAVIELFDFIIGLVPGL